MMKPLHLYAKNGKTYSQKRLLSIYLVVLDTIQNRFFAGRIKKYIIFRWR